MISQENRIQIEREKGETEMLVLMALAIAGFDSAPRGLDPSSDYRQGQKLTADDVADLDLIHFAPTGAELVMVSDSIGEIHGRDCSLHVAPVAGSPDMLEVNRDLYEGWIDDLLLRARDELEPLIRANRRNDVLSVAARNHVHH